MKSRKSAAHVQPTEVLVLRASEGLARETTEVHEASFQSLTVLGVSWAIVAYRMGGAGGGADGAEIWGGAGEGETLGRGWELDVAFCKARGGNIVHK